MSIAPFQPASAAPPSTQKAEGKSSASGKHGRHDDAGTDSGLGFLAELAAASVAIAPIVPQTPVPTLPTGKAGDALAGATKGAAASVLAAELAPTAAGGSSLTAGLPAALGATAALPGTPTAQPADAAQALVAAAVASPPVAPAQIAQPGQPSRPAPINTAATPVKPSATTAKGGPKPDPATAPQTEAAPGAALTDAGAPDRATTPAATATATTDTAPSPARPASASTDAALSTIAAAAATDPFSAAAVSAPTPVTNEQPPAQTTAVLRQVFPEITKAVATGPGTHRIAITLHPDDLGEVRVTVVVRGDSVRVDVATDPLHGVARTALEHGAPELRKLLEATGADAKVTFREFGTPSATTGSATDGGRNQAFAQAQAQLQAQAEARSNGQGGGAYAPDRADEPGSSGPTAPAGAPEDTSVPTARRATSGVDQLI